MEENIIETKKCKHCSASFSITDADVALYQKIAPMIGGVKYDLPHPTFCPDCRQQRRLAWRNERKLYHGTCDLSGKHMVSLYSPDKKIPVYHYPEWRSDKRNELDYGQEYDFTKSFFEQFQTLLYKVPRISTYHKRSENSEYGSNVIDDKNCYMVFISGGSEHCMYCHTQVLCKNCVDCLWTVSCQKCYACTKAQNCYECFHCFNCQGCFNSQYLVDCFNTDNSSFCIGLRNKKYYVLNKAYTESEYKDFLEKLQQDKIFQDQMRQKFAELKLQTPVNANMIEQSENSTGNYLDNCKDCAQCFDVILGEDCKYCYDGANCADNMDVSLGGAGFTQATSVLAYETDNSFNSSALYFTSSVAFHSYNVLYSDTCHDCKDCFGCVGLRHKQYCILNTQYTKEAYETLVPQIIEKMKADGEWGEFFPTTMSIFGYNETEAQTYYPLTKEEAVAKGWKWHDDVETKIPEGSDVIYAKDLPDIQNTTDDILQKVIVCEVTGKPFKIIKQELDLGLE